MESVFHTTDYRKFLVAQMKAMPNSGYGQSRKLAEYLNVHTTLVSQVIKSKKTFTLEQAAAVCEFFALSEMESDYFLLLVQLDRAGTSALRKNLLRQIEKMRAQSKELVNRLSSKKKLSEEDRALFYSDWAYSAVRQLIAIEGFQSLDAIADYFGFSRRRTREILDFLLRVRFILDEGGRVGLRVGPATTHLESSSAWVRTHHMNWREKAIEGLGREGHAQLNYTAPMTLSKQDAEIVRERIVKLLESVDRVVEPSASEGLFCLNIDWFEVSR